MPEPSKLERELQQVQAEKKERTKELSCINETTSILRKGQPIEESLQQLVLILPKAWQYPEYTCSRITYNSKEYRSADFEKSKWVQSQSFKTIDDIEGTIELFYTKEFPTLFEGPFLKEERDLIINLANIFTGYINSFKAKQLIKSSQFNKEEYLQEESPVESSRQLLQSFLDKRNAARYIFHDLMPFKVKEILLVATLYDAYIIEGEGRFSDHILGEYHQLNLSSVPRVTGVSSQEEAFERLKQKHFDLIILMVGVEKRTPVVLSKRIKEAYPYIPIFLLLNNSSDYSNFQGKEEAMANIDNFYVWNGDSQVFFAMVKLLEDKVNVENDTKIGLTRIILLVEDSSLYYSRYLPILYSVLMEQTKHIIDDVSTDDLYKVLKMRARPKILLATNYEEALDVFDKYKDYMLCVISDARFPKEKKLDDKAGLKLIKYVKSQIINLPTLLQSSDSENQKLAHEVQSAFIDKNSETLLQDLKSFINYHLGFGHFVYRNHRGKQIAIAKSMKEFEKLLRTVPEESLVYHGVKNHFSLWLMARGEIQIAKIINPLKITDFDNPNELREFIIKIIQRYRNEKDKGKVIAFEESAVNDESNIVSFAGGSMGGKGRGLAFINTLIYDFDLSNLKLDINIRTPVTSIIGTEEFDIFMEKNHLFDIIHSEQDYEKLKKAFIDSQISFNLDKKLRIFLRLITKPLAIRSSSMFEDSLMQPFSGIFGTYLLPNNHPDFDTRMQQAANAIKLVYASIYSPNARTYFRAINQKVENEKMAVVIQEVVGNEYDGSYYPHISGTAQSHNYYPVSHMKPEEGFAVAAIGLGQYVVEGEKAFRFSPSYPQLEIISPKDLYKNSQTTFYAVNLEKSNLNLLDGEDAGLIKLDISEAENHGNLKHCASVYDKDNDRILPGLDTYGPRIVNFANILKYEYIPLAGAVKYILDIVNEALGCPVEIEYAIDLNRTLESKPSFYLLQIKPLVGTLADYEIDLKKMNKEKLVLFSNQSMGNGIIEDIRDVIYVKIEKFVKTKTMEMTGEIEKLNDRMLTEGKRYILIGPGRWGTRDRFIGVPVAWPQISNAKVIVEMSLKDFPLDASLGSHFFHNVTSMNVGYFSVNHTNPDDFIKWEDLHSQELVEETKYFKHIRFKHPLVVKMDGKKLISIISMGQNTNG